MFIKAYHKRLKSCATIIDGKADSLPDCLSVTAVVANDAHAELSLTESALAGDEIMGLQHKDYPIQGLQFHPESFATEGARRLLTNFLLQV